MSRLAKASKNKPHRGYCSACNKPLRAKLLVLLKHSRAKPHQENVSAPDQPRGQIDSLIKRTSANSELDSQVKRAEIKIAAFKSEHNIAFNVMDHLSDLLPTLFPDSQIASHIKCKHTKTT